jgi:hypothetical protein
MALAPYPGFCAGTYQDPLSTLLGLDTCVNLWPVLNEAGTGKGRFAFRKPPGRQLKLTLLTSPGRGIWSGDETAFYCVSGDRLYRVDVTTHAAVDRGPVGNNGAPVNLFHNGFSQLGIVSALKLYVDSGAGPVEITTCPAAASAGGQGVEYGVFLDGYGIVAERNTNNIYLSSLNDLTTWSALDKQVWYATQDRVLALAADPNHRLWLLGRKSIEIWGNVGGSGFPFQRVAGASINNGLIGAFAWAFVPNVDGSDTLCFVSMNDRGRVRVFSADGYRARRISSGAIENYISNLLFLSDCVANGYVEGQHSQLYLSFPTGNRCLVYDFSTGMWFERLGGSPGARVEPPGRYHTAPPAMQGPSVHYWLSGTTGKVFRDESGVWQDDGAAMHSERTGPNASDSDQSAFFGTFRIDCKTTVGASGVTLEVSRDNGTTFDPPRTMYASNNGRSIVEWTRLGSGRSFVPRIRHSDNAQLVIAGAYMDADSGGGY